MHWVFHQETFETRAGKARSDQLFVINTWVHLAICGRSVHCIACQQQPCNKECDYFLVERLYVVACRNFYAKEGTSLKHAFFPLKFPEIYR